MHQDDCAVGFLREYRFVNLRFGNARPVKRVYRPIYHGRGKVFTTLVYLSKRRTKKVLFFTVYPKKKFVRAFDFQGIVEVGKGGKIGVGIAVIAQLPTERIRRVQGMNGGFVDKPTVTKEGGGGDAVGVGFVEDSKDGEDIFEGFRRGIVESECNQFSGRVYGGNIGIGYVPNVFVCGEFARDIAFHFRGVKFVRSRGGGGRREMPFCGVWLASGKAGCG